jgi:hypothetical protein
MFFYVIFPECVRVGPLWQRINSHHLDHVLSSFIEDKIDMASKQTISLSV